MRVPEAPVHKNKRKILFETVFEGIGEAKRGLISYKELSQYEDLLCTNPEGGPFAYIRLDANLSKEANHETEKQREISRAGASPTAKLA